MKVIPGLNLVSTAIDIYDIGKLVVPAFWNFMFDGEEINYVPIPDRVKMLFDWMNKNGQYALPETLPETQIKAYLKFLDQLGDNQAVANFVEKWLAHPTSGGLDNPEAIKALYDAQKTFKREEVVNDGLNKLAIKTTLIFESAEWVDEKKEQLLVTKQVVFSDLPDKSYPVQMLYDTILIYDVEKQEASKYEVKRTKAVEQYIEASTGKRLFSLGGSDKANFIDNKNPKKQVWEKL